MGQPISAERSRSNNHVCVVVNKTSDSLGRVSRLARETGFGDFCFGRLEKADRMKSKHWAYTSPINVLMGTKLEKDDRFRPLYDFLGHGIEEWTKEEIASNSNNTPVAELDGFVREKTFPFFKLPAEIRHTILRIVLAPLFKYDAGLKQALAEFSIDEIIRDGCDDYFSGNVQEYLECCSSTQARLRGHMPESILDDITFDEPDATTTTSTSSTDYLVDLSPSERSIIETRYAKLKKSFQSDAMNHPRRKLDYEVQANLPNTSYVGDKRTGSRIANRFRRTRRVVDSNGLEDVHPRLDFPMLEFIRQLSNINTQLRQDLGTVIWAHTKIHVTAHAAMSFRPMSFLVDRPAIYKGIRSMALDVPCGNTYMRNAFNHLVLLILFISNQLKLDYLQVNFQEIRMLQYEDDGLENLCQGLGRFSKLQDIRQINVSKSFKLTFGEDAPFHASNLEGKPEDYLNRLKHLIMPNTLRALDDGEK